MKKILALAAIALFTITSCSDDDSSATNNTNTEGVLLKKMIETIDGETLTSQFTYDGTKLTGITNSDGTNEVITYTGGLITSWKKYDGNTLINEYEYIYNPVVNTLKKEIYNDYENNTTDTSDFFHNPDGSITYSSTTYLGDGKFTIDRYTRHLANLDVSYVATYDGKNNPFKNITGMSKIYFWKYNGYGIDINQNVLTLTRVIANDPDSLLESYTYTYNSMNYPLTEVIRDHENNDIISSTTQYFYE